MFCSFVLCWSNVSVFYFFRGSNNKICTTVWCGYPPFARFPKEWAYLWFHLLKGHSPFSIRREMYSALIFFCANGVHLCVSGLSSYLFAFIIACTILLRASHGTILSRVVFTTVFTLKGRVLVQQSSRSLFNLERLNTARFWTLFQICSQLRFSRNCNWF